MRIITKTTIKQYIESNPQSKSALSEWIEKTEKAEWHSLADIKNI